MKRILSILIVIVIISTVVIPCFANVSGLSGGMGNASDVLGVSSSSFASGSVPQYVTSSGFGDCLLLNGGSSLDITVPSSDTWTVEFRVNLGAYQDGLLLDSDIKSSASGRTISPKSLSTSYPSSRDNKVYFLCDYRMYNLDGSILSFKGSNDVERYRFFYESSNLEKYQRVDDNYYYMAKESSPTLVQGLFGVLPANQVVGTYDASQFRFSTPSYLSYSTVSPLPLGQWISFSIVCNGDSISAYANGVLFPEPFSSAYAQWSKSVGDIHTLSLHGVNALSYLMVDELRITNQALYTSNYNVSSVPFDISKVLVLPDSGVDGQVAVKSAINVGSVRVGGVRPSYPSNGDVYVYLDDKNCVSSVQQYQLTQWKNVDASIYQDSVWVTLKGVDFTSSVIAPDDFVDVQDKSDDDSGKNNNPESTPTNITVHYYVENTSDKVRRDTLFQNLAVGATFVFSAPSVTGYKPLIASHDIVVTENAEYVVYYAKDSGTGPDDPSIPTDPSSDGFWNKLGSLVGGIFSSIFGFLGNIISGLLSGITSIIGTLGNVFKSIIGLGGQFGGFLSSALVFIPKEIIDLIIAGISVAIICAVIKFIRG